MKRLTGKLTREDILNNKRVTFFTNSTLETRMVLDVLRFDMGFRLANEAVAKLQTAEFDGAIAVDSSGQIWQGFYESSTNRGTAVATIHNLIPDYVDPVTAQFNKLADRLTAIEARLDAMEQKAQPIVAKAVILDGLGNARS
ncbi:MAG: hypothetical protein AB7H77_12420 [Bdellovibrionales bacterium]